MHLRPAGGDQIPPVRLQIIAQTERDRHSRYFRETHVLRGLGSAGFRSQPLDRIFPMDYKRRMDTDCAQELTDYRRIMRKREIWLPDKIDEMALAHAQAAGIDVSAYYAGLLSDHLLDGRPLKSQVLCSGLRPGQLAHRPETVDSQRVQSREVAGFIRDQSDSDRPIHECDFAYFINVEPEWALMC